MITYITPKLFQTHYTDKMLKGVVGLVTGGASGLGKATVERIVREGGKVRIINLLSSILTQTSISGDDV